MSVPQNPNPYGPASWPPPQHTAPPRKRRRWPWILGMVGTLMLGFVIGSSGGVSAGYQNGYEQAMADGVQGSHQSASSYTPPAVLPDVPATPSFTETPAEVLSGYGNGTYQVGTDMEPGRYKTTGPPATSFAGMCYWERSSNDSGELQSIIANDNIQGQGSVTVNSGEFVKFSGGCQWEKQ